jgi:hypothetical protein
MDDDDWDKLSPEEQDAYNDRVDADTELLAARTAYDTSMSLKGPAVLGVIGFIFIPFLWLALTLIVIAVFWAIIRVAARTQAYQRYKDAQAAVNALKDIHTD